MSLFVMIPATMRPWCECQWLTTRVALCALNLCMVHSPLDLQVSCIQSRSVPLTHCCMTCTLSCRHSESSLWWQRCIFPAAFLRSPTPRLDSLRFSTHSDASELLNAALDTSRCSLTAWTWEAPWVVFAWDRGVRAAATVAKPSTSPRW